MDGTFRILAAVAGAVLEPPHGDVCAGLKAPLYGCMTGVQDSIIAAAVVAVFVALVWRPLKRSLAARQGPAELTPGIARQIKDRVRLDGSSLACNAQ